MKHFNKLSILIVSLRVTSIMATVDLCCADIEQVDLGLLALLEVLGYSAPVNVGAVCTPSKGSCELLATACQTSFADNTIGLNCFPANFVVPPGNLELCCAQIIPTDAVLAKQLLSQAGYNGSLPIDVATGCIQVAVGSTWFVIIIFRKYAFRLKTHPSELLDVKCQEALADNLTGVNCIPTAFLDS
ncbi:hypothetical protein C8R45DRAFT_1109001 [Mycena sanguinolenta]|nr:hypothetical protein C8R45DRAFT_1109001 [Mycena sanguinolenta]